MALDVFVDTSAWYALVDTTDSNHQGAVRFSGTSPSMITTNFIIDETITLVLSHLSYAAALAVGKQLWEARIAEIVWLTEEDQMHAWELFKRYHDKTFSFTDCTSFVIMRRLGLIHAFTFDEHFEQTGQFIRVPAPV